MNLCPVCHQRLEPVKYEGFNVLQCSACKGHLLELPRLEGIKRVHGKSDQDLKSEAKSDFKGSTSRVLRCPRCRRDMRKESLKLPALEAQADLCDDCSLVWLDPGELALIQIAYEATSQAANIDDLKRRVHALDADPDRKAAFDANLSRLPSTSGSVADVFELPDDLCETRSLSKILSDMFGPD